MPALAKNMLATHPNKLSYNVTQCGVKPFNLPSRQSIIQSCFLDHKSIILSGKYYLIIRLHLSIHSWTHGEMVQSSYISSETSLKKYFFGKPLSIVTPPVYNTNYKHDKSYADFERILSVVVLSVLFRVVIKILIFPLDMSYNFGYYLFESAQVYKRHEYLYFQYI